MAKSIPNIKDIHKAIANQFSSSFIPTPILQYFD